MWLNGIKAEVSKTLNLNEDSTLANKGWEFRLKDLGIKNWVTGSNPKGQPRTEKKRRTGSKRRTSRPKRKTSNPLDDTLTPIIDKARKEAIQKGEAGTATLLGAVQFHLEDPKESDKWWRKRFG